MKYPVFFRKSAAAVFLFLAPAAVGWAEESPDPRTSGPAGRGDAWTPAWGFWPKVPLAWQQTFRGQVAEVKKGPAQVVFLGDSITAGWLNAGKTIWNEKIRPLGAVNLGIGGDTTRQVLWRLEQGTLDGADPKLIVLLIGVNNIFTATGSDEEISRGLEEVVKQLQGKCPAAKILVLGIFPLGNSAQSERAKNINALVEKKLPASVRFLDLSETFRNPDGTIQGELYNPDGTHLATAGYEAWWRNLQPVVEEMLK